MPDTPPVTSPVDALIDAIVGLLLLQVPPDGVLDKVSVLPTHTPVPEKSDGVVFTLTVFVDVQPVIGSV